MDVIFRKFKHTRDEMQIVDLEREHNELMHLCSKQLPTCKEEDEENICNSEIEKGQIEAVQIQIDPNLKIEYGNNESIRLTKFKRLDSVNVHAAGDKLKNPRRFQRSLSVEEYCKIKLKQNFRTKSHDQILLPLSLNASEQLCNSRKTFKCHLPPVAIIVISLLEIIFFIIDDRKYLEPSATSHTNQNINDIGVINYWLRYDPYRRIEVWRFVTYMFVHVDVTHLAVNIVTQLIFGVALELLHCRWRTVAIYVAGVVFGALGTSIEDPNIFLVGASSGVYALLAACICTVASNWRDLEYALIYMFVLLLVTITETVFSLLDYFDGRQDVVSYMAHLFGAIAGFILGMAILIVHSETQCKRALRRASGAFFVLVTLVLILWHFISVNNNLVPRTRS